MNDKGSLSIFKSQLGMEKHGLQLDSSFKLMMVVLSFFISSSNRTGALSINTEHWINESCYTLLTSKSGEGILILFCFNVQFIDVN